MTRNAAAEAHTYVTEADDAQIVDFVRALQASGRGVPEARPALLGADGSRHEIPQPIYEALRQVADALVDGMGVTVAPRSARLTTQEAAEFLGVSRPTLVRMLERGDLPMEKPGRHRYVRLDDLVAYQAARRMHRRSALDAMQTQSAEDGVYEATDGTPPLRR